MQISYHIFQGFSWREQPNLYLQLPIFDNTSISTYPVDQSSIYVLIKDSSLFFVLCNNTICAGMRRRIEHVLLLA